MKRGLVAFTAGAIFSAGLCVSEMTQPSKVLAFLDFTGNWDPSLAFVMIGAIAVAALAFRLAARRPAPIVGDRFHLPERRAPIDARLLSGAALFGVGWGLSGLCPGPALTSLGSGQIGSLVFVTAMVAGMVLHDASERAAASARSERGPSA